MMSALNHRQLSNLGDALGYLQVTVLTNNFEPRGGRFSAAEACLLRIFMIGNTSKPFSMAIYRLTEGSRNDATPADSGRNIELKRNMVR